MASGRKKKIPRYQEPVAYWDRHNQALVARQWTGRIRVRSDRNRPAAPPEKSEGTG
jgi:hypothetical protein